MSLADYLAKNYLHSDSKKSKKKKSKAVVEDAGLLITEDTVLDHSAPLDSAEDEDDEVSINEPIAPKVHKWKKLGSGEEVVRSSADVSKATETVPASEPAQPSDIPRMSSGARAGLQTAQQVREELELKRQAELQSFLSEGQTEQQAETVYRDASGRRIDIMAEMDQQRQAEREAVLAKEKRQRELNRGLVQASEAEKRKRQLDEMEGASFSVYANDDTRNKQLKEKVRFNDPAARFLESVKESYENPTESSGLPVYKGAYPANRFGIAPGCLWDGVDRSNGFEKRWFQKQNERKEKATLSYTMALDD